MRRSRMILVAAAFGAAGCDLVREPTPLGPLEHAVAVHAVLRADDDTARVLISRTRIDAPESGFDPVSGADVRISGPFGDAVLREAAPGMGRCTNDIFVPGTGTDAPDAEAGCYAAILPAAVRAGGRYGLRITLPNGDIVTGETVVPAAPSITTGTDGEPRLAVPADGDADAVPAVLTFSWSGVDAAAMTEVGFSQRAVFLGDTVAAEDVMCGVSYSLFPVGAEDGSAPWELRVSGASCAARQDPEDPNGWQPVAWDSIAAAVHVTAFDSTYARYVEEVLQENARRRDRSSMGIEGAVGVFGSVAVGKRPVMLIRDRP